MTVRPTHDQVLLLAPDPAAAAAALVLAVPASWSAAGCDDTAVWGQFIATSAEPYDVAVDLSADQATPAYRCSCPSRKIPCKHALGLLLLHADGMVLAARRLPFAAQWLQRRAAPRADTTADPGPATESLVVSHDGEVSAPASRDSVGGSTRSSPHELGGADPLRDKRRLERAERMRAGLVELDRWLADRVRRGLAAPEFAEAATWERLAQRLVDAQCGGLANRVKRVATKVGRHPGWHDDVLHELALLHALAVGAQRTSMLPTDLADGVHAATGLTVAKDDVLTGVPSSGHWLVVGESRTREDRITVQRTWLCTPQTPTTWAMLLAFGAFGNEVTTECRVGSSFTGDVHWYPGGIALRALVGRTSDLIAHEPAPPPATSISVGVGHSGWAIANEPWLERYPLCIQATPRRASGAAWVLADDSGAVALDPAFDRVAELVCVCGGRPAIVMGELSADGLLPLTLWANDGLVQL